MANFKLPISYVTNTYNVDTNVINDLELTDPNTTLYKKVLAPDTQMGCDLIKIWAEHYTTNVSFLKDTQTLITKSLPILKENYSDDIDIWNKINGNQKIIPDDGEKKDESPIGFHEKYNYIEWEYLKHLNNSAICMQWLSIYNMFSPVLTLIMPIIFMIMPFVILKLQGTNVSLTNYIE